MKLILFLLIMLAPARPVPACPVLTQTTYRTGLVRYHKPTIFRVDHRPGEVYGVFLSFTNPIQVDPLLMWGANTANTQILPNFVGNLDQTGRAWPVINMPAMGVHPQLVGFQFSMQAITPSGRSNTLDLKISN